LNIKNTFAVNQQ